MSTQTIYICDCGTKLRFPCLDKKIKVTCPECNKCFYFENKRKAPYDNFILIAKYMTYCCEAIREKFPDEKEKLILFWGIGLATQQYRLAGQITISDLARVVLDDENDFETMVTKMIILELAADSPQYSLDEVAEYTSLKIFEINTVIKESKKEFPNVQNQFAQYARIGAMSYPTKEEMQKFNGEEEKRTSENEV